MVLPLLPVETGKERVLYADGGTVGGSPGNRGVRWSVGDGNGAMIRAVDSSGRFRRSDEAEFLAFVAALKYLQTVCERGEHAVIRTDCSTVLHHFGGARKPKSRRLHAIYQEGRALMGELRFRGVRVDVAWHNRDEVEAVLGH